MNIGQLITKMDKNFSGIMEVIRTAEYNIYEISTPDFRKIIFDNINLTITDKEFKIMTNNSYGCYTFCNNKEEVVENLKMDYFEWRVIDKDRFRSTVQFKKYILSMCI